MEVKQFGKKGMFLTFISIAIIAAAVMIFTPSDINLRKDITVIKTRVTNVNNYVLDLENVYLERTLHATGTKTIIALTRYMNAEGLFLTDFDHDFNTTLLDGTIGGVDIDTYYPETIMTGNTYNDWLNRIKTTAQDTYNVDTSFLINDIKVYQINPWFVNVDANITFSVSSETASWNKTVIVKTEIEIERFDDPYYLVKTSGTYVNKIRKTGTKFNEWTVDKVKDFIRDGNYTHWDGGNAPSFIMRFTNDISPSSCCSIESLVNPNKPSTPDQYTSYVDYLYWSTTPSCDDLSLYTVAAINSEFPDFKWDFSHLAKYKLTADSQICPP